MRIAIDATYSVDPHPSGIAIYSQELLKGLAAQYPADSIFACYRPKQWTRRNLTAGTKLRTRILQRPLPLGKVDMFHALNQRVDWRPAPKVISTFHDLFVMTAEYSTAEFRQRFTAQAREAAARSDLIIAVSQFTAGQIHQLLGVERSRIRVVPHGVHLPAGATEEEAREKMILFVGALQTRKNVLALVQAFEQLESWNWNLVLAGAPSGYGAAAIIDYIERSPARARIRITGYVPDSELQRLYRRASVFAFPSLDEGFGIPVLEAMAHGLPVLTSNRSALVEVAGDAAIQVDPTKIEEICAGLKALQEDDALRTRLARLGLKQAEQFSWSRSVRMTHEVYEEISTT